MRAAFNLRDAFDHTFEEISDDIWRSPTACRPILTRARRKLAGADVPLSKPSEEVLPLVNAFWKASRTGDMQGLLDLFTEEIEVHTDGGGRVSAAINVPGIFGSVQHGRLLSDEIEGPAIGLGRNDRIRDQARKGRSLRHAGLDPDSGLAKVRTADPSSESWSPSVIMRVGNLDFHPVLGNSALAGEHLPQAV